MCISATDVASKHVADSLSRFIFVFPDVDLENINKLSLNLWFVCFDFRNLSGLFQAVRPSSRLLPDSLEQI